MKIALVGDIALFGKFSREGNPDVFSYLESMSRYLRQFDLVVGNLETPFGDNLPVRGAKSAYLKSLPANVELLEYLNIGLVNLANNHLFDYGVEGYRSTLQVLERHGIDWFGAEARQVELTDEPIAFLGYCSYNTNPLGISKRGGLGVNALNVRDVEDRLRNNASRGLLNVLSIHSGQEHVHQPSRDDIRMARKFAKIAPYVYYGHHPHVMQGVEVLDGSLIAYSVGNFCFDDVYTDKSPLPLVKQTRANKSGLVLELEVVGGQLRNHKLTTIFADTDSMVVDDPVGRQALAAHSALLDLPEPEYSERRRSALDEITAGRRAMRDFRWFIKRLNWRTADLVIRGKLNAGAYRRNVTQFLGKE